MTPAIKYTLITDGKNSAPPKSKACNFRYDLYLQILLFCAFMSILLLYKYPRSDFQYELIAGNSSNFLVHRQDTLSNDDYDNVDDGAHYTNSTLSDDKNKYFVHTKECVIPYVDPVTSGASVIYKPKTVINCSDDEAFVDSIYDVNSKQYILHINYEVAESKLLNSSDELSCCYSEILRAGRGAAADKKTKLLPCANFHQDFKVPQRIGGCIIECKSVLTKKLLQKDAFSFVQYKNDTTHTDTANSHTKKPSILMIGIDSVSRINLRRTMPKTTEYLEKNSWYELQGYNKIADNTYPNFMAFLVGLASKEAFKICQPYSVGGLDKCNFIWKLFKSNGYRTAYAEDLTTLSTFNYLKKGFQNPPTDYYLRPFILAIDSEMKSKKISSLKYCVGRRQYGEYIYDYAVEFGQRYMDEPAFGLFWTNSFSHNAFDATSRMDLRMRRYLIELEETGILDTSIVIFLSDHGSRFGPLLKIPSGFLENRLPMLFIWLPNWFRSQYPEFVRALKTNQHRLTSPYDIHMTLKHILKLGNPEMKLEQSQGCAKCQTIFAEVPKNRTCEDAGITAEWCTCVPYQTLSKTDKTAKIVARLVIDEMNKYLHGKNMSSLCRKMTFKSMTWAGMHSEGSSKLDSKQSIRRYRIEFKISENSATFEGSPAYNVAKKSVQINVEEINRTNSYAKDSPCIEDNIAKKYCIYCTVLKVGEIDPEIKKLLDLLSVLPCIAFHQDFYVPEHINGIIVECMSVLNQTILQKDGFSFVQYKNVTTNQTGRSDIRKPSVLMIGIDSVSRINLRRVMPRTAAHLIDNNWFELQGYNKVGDNTYPNLMAFLVGYNHNGAYKICKPATTGGLDKCDFVWKLFKNNGYRTAYAEDTTGIGTFVYLKKGFQEPPTDYYMRPFFMAIEKKFIAKWISGSKYCIGRRRYAEYIYDHALQFGQRYNDEPIFGLFWTNSFSHNYYHTPALMDERMRTYLMDLEETGILDTSIVIFLSDHGMRWGKLIGLKSGFLENRLPMLFIWLPIWFRNEYPEYVKALEANRNRLTSPFDLHMTLKHIVKIGNPAQEVSPAQGCEKCQTLFEEIPENRTCNDAGIPPYWCTCNPFKKLKLTDPTIRNVTNLVINEMNEYLHGRNMSSLCREITLKAVTWGGRELILHPSLDDKSFVRYKIEFMISENNATFEARPQYIVDNQTVNIDVEEIGRTNTYEGDSHCVRDDMAKKYCICKI